MNPSELCVKCTLPAVQCSQISKNIFMLSKNRMIEISRGSIIDITEHTDVAVRPYNVIPYFYVVI
jgi:hypothetical protein